VAIINFGWVDEGEYPRNKPRARGAHRDARGTYRGGGGRGGDGGGASGDHGGVQFGGWREREREREAGAARQWGNWRPPPPSSELAQGQ